MTHTPMTNDQRTGTHHHRFGRALFVAIVATALFAGVGVVSASAGGGPVDPTGNVTAAPAQPEPVVPRAVLFGGGTVDPSGN